MMKKSSLTRLGVGTASVALLMTAVIGNATSSSATGNKGGTLYILTAGDDILHLDPQRNYTGEDMAFSSAYLTRSLTQYSLDANPAKASVIIGDGAVNGGVKLNAGKDWKFAIRKGMKWEDGSTVTCADFAYGISRTFAVEDIFDGPNYASVYLDIPANADSANGTAYPGPYNATKAQQALFDKAAECTGTQAAGETLTLHLNTAVSDFNGAATLTAFSAVKKSADTGTTYDQNILSDGPYKVQTHVADDKLVLVRNPNWAAATDPTRPAYPDKIEYDFGITPQVVTERLMANSGDDKYAVSPDGVYPTYLTEVMAAQSQYSARKIVGFDPYVTYTAINTSRVTSLAKRQAIIAAWPRETGRTLAGGDYAGSYADGVIKPSMGKDYRPTNLWGYNTYKTVSVPAKAAVKAAKKGAKFYCGTQIVADANVICTPAVAAYDSVTTTPHPGLLGYVIPDNGSCDIAKAILSKAGISDPGKLTFDYSDKGSPITAQNAAAVKSALSCAGFEVTLHGIASGYYSKVLNPATQGDLSNAGWGPDWANASTVIPPLFSDGGFDLSRFNNSSFKSAVEAAMKNGNRAAQAKQWQDLNISAMSNALVVPKLFTSVQRLQGSGVNGAYIWGPYGSYPYATLSVN
jgi:peptide/nickel transport system substrate-binding protein